MVTVSEFCSGTIPIRERLRLAALQSYKILDTGCEPHFDQFVKDATRRFAVPISTISLVDTDRQWFKASIGLNVTETDRRISFCTHALDSNEPFVVLDAWADPLFAGNPLVQGSPYIRFYAGAPLSTPLGRRIGTFNVIGSRARTVVPKEDLEWLKAKAAEIMQILEDRRARDIRRRALAGEI